MIYLSYESLMNLPCINGVTVIGDRTFEDFGLVPMTSEDITEIILEVFGYVL